MSRSSEREEERGKNVGDVGVMPLGEACGAGGGGGGAVVLGFWVLGLGFGF